MSERKLTWGDYEDMAIAGSYILKEHMDGCRNCDMEDFKVCGEGRELSNQVSELTDLTIKGKAEAESK